jgi:hypothetical protein
MAAAAIYGREGGSSDVMLPPTGNTSQSTNKPFTESVVVPWCTAAESLSKFCSECVMVEGKKQKPISFVEELYIVTGTDFSLDLIQFSRTTTTIFYL